MSREVRKVVRFAGGETALGESKTACRENGKHPESHPRIELFSKRIEHLWRDTGLSRKGMLGRGCVVPRVLEVGAEPHAQTPPLLDIVHNPQCRGGDVDPGFL